LFAQYLRSYIFVHLTSLFSAKIRLICKTTQ
jgi:hypothetical protein